MPNNAPSAEELLKRISQQPGKYFVLNNNAPSGTWRLKWWGYEGGKFKCMTSVGGPFVEAPAYPDEATALEQLRTDLREATAFEESPAEPPGLIHLINKNFKKEI